MSDSRQHMFEMKLKVLPLVAKLVDRCGGTKGQKCRCGGCQG